MIRHALALGALVLGLVGCGNDAEVTERTSAYRQVATSLVARRGAAPVGPPATAPPGLTRAMVEALDVPVDLVTFEGLRLVAAITPVGVNGGVETWASLDQKSVALRDGMVVATRGIGPDLISASVPGPARVAAGGSWERVLVTLDGDDQQQRLRLSCNAVQAGAARIVILERSHDTRLVRETCTAPGMQITNEYWFEGGSKLRQSRQWLGRELGHAAIRRLGR